MNWWVFISIFRKYNKVGNSGHHKKSQEDRNQDTWSESEYLRRAIPFGVQRSRNGIL